ncbi:hypothetical protein DQ04_00411060 [Trypanosoma grayi]|uniref:hypothetical protein n=1 Tax=Trypanosoma grayi TaxID=71804 RepID=UPI0004F48210|nr:hypothetical protein DQ04_00411060 [Trypanosoma grayi]KEG14542.1 hypothetical protein DQ04_00411060 [Trypanosoma grayi]
MFNARRETEAGACGALHPLRFRLACERLRCPYDLPLDLGRRCGPQTASWFSTLLGKPQPPVRRSNDAVSNTGAVGTTHDGEEAIVSETGAEREEVSSGTSSPLPPPLLSSANDGHGGPVSTECVAASGWDSWEADAATEARPSTDDADSTEDEKSSQQSERSVALHSSHGSHRAPALRGEITTPTQICAPSDEGVQCNIIREDPGFSDVAGDPDDGDGDANDTLPLRNDNIDSATPTQLHQLEGLLSSTVEKLYTKLQGTALKVVALDDLNRQLVEHFHQPQQQQKAVEDKTELAIYLYSLRRQVELLKNAWDAHEAARLDAERRLARQSNAVEKVVRVEVVRAYETPPVPYKKPPYMPLTVTRRQSVASSRQSNTSPSTTSSSVLSSASTETSSSRLSTSSVTSVEEELYSDDFEDE